MKYRILFAGIVIACAAFVSSCDNSSKKDSDTAATVNGTETYTDTASSFIKVFDQNGRVCIQKSNTYYELIDVYEGSTKTPLMLKIKKTELCFADSTNKDKVYEVDAKSIMDSKAVNWQAQFVATEVLFKDNTIIAVHEGGETEEDLITHISLVNGKDVFRCSYGDLKVAIPNVKDKRFIGYTSRNATTNPIKALNEENIVGTIQYSDGSKSIDVLKIKVKRSPVAEKIPSYTPEMVLVAANENTKAIEDGKSLILMRADEKYQAKDVTDFSAQFIFYYGDDNESTKIIIPVANDRLDLAHAIYDKDIFEILPK